MYSAIPFPVPVNFERDNRNTIVTNGHLYKMCYNENKLIIRELYYVLCYILFYFFAIFYNAILQKLPR